MPIIYCNFNLGDWKHTVQLVTDKASSVVGEFTSHELPEAIAVAAMNADIHEVHLTAPSAYAPALSAAITSYAKSKFSNFDLNVEIHSPN